MLTARTWDSIFHGVARVDHLESDTTHHSGRAHRLIRNGCIYRPPADPAGTDMQGHALNRRTGFTGLTTDDAEVQQWFVVTMAINRLLRFLPYKLQQVAPALRKLDGIYKRCRKRVSETQPQVRGQLFCYRSSLFARPLLEHRPDTARKPICNTPGLHKILAPFCYCLPQWVYLVYLCTMEPRERALSRGDLPPDKLEIETCMTSCR